MTLQVVFRKIGPERRIWPEVLERLRLKRADFTDRRFHAIRLFDDKATERITDVARHVRRPPSQNQRVGQKFRERRFPIGPGDRQNFAVPEKRGEIQFAETNTSRRPRRRQPEMLHWKAGTEHHQPMPGRVHGGELIFRVRRFLVVKPPHSPDPGQQRKHALTAHTPAENGDWALQQRGNFVGR